MEDDRYVLHGPEPFEPLPEDTIGQLMYDSLMNCSPSHEAFIDAHTGQSLSGKNLLEKSCNLAKALLQSGVNIGTAVAISSENCLEFFIPVVATLYIGATVVPVNPIYTPYELKHLLDISTPKIVFCSRNVLPKFLLMKKETSCIEQIIVIDTNSNIAGAEYYEDFIYRNLKGNTMSPLDFKPYNKDPHKLPAFIMCSSGTTGMPKGVMVSHKNVAMKVAHARDPKYKFDKPNIMAYLPFFHGYGLNLCVTTIITQHRLILLKRFEEDLFLKTIQDYKINILPVAPPTAVFLSKTPKFANYKLSSVRAILCGAAPLSKYTEESLRQRFNLRGICQGYGLTEAYEGIAKMEKGQSRPGSCGKLMTFVTCKIRDPESGKSLGPHEVGEICLKGPMLMMGYHKNEAATKEAFTSDGWLRTGDLAYYDEEECFYIVDRLKELIKYKGFQVAPAELESILIKHDGVKDVAVVGKPDDEAGELPCAFVVKNDGAEVTEKELIDFVASHVSPQKKLRGGIIFTTEIPKNPSGKKLRKILRELVRKMAEKPKAKL